MSDSDRTKRIRELNDALRKDPTRFGRAVVTRGVNDLGPDFAFLAARAIASFDAFTKDNDPYGEHDFGAFEHAGATLFFKIDLYEETLVKGSAARNSTRTALTRADRRRLPAHPGKRLGAPASE